MPRAIREMGFVHVYDNSAWGLMPTVLLQAESWRGCLLGRRHPALAGESTRVASVAQLAAALRDLLGTPQPTATVGTRFVLSFKIMPWPVAKMNIYPASI